MARKTKEKRDPVSLAISVIVHVAMIGGVGYWAAKTGKLDEITRRILQAVRSDKKEQKQEPPKPQQAKAQPTKLPPINQGAPPSGGGGSRRAVAADAPAAVGESFFADTRTQTKGASKEGKGGETNAAPKVAAPVAVVRQLPRPIFQSAAPKSDIKQLLIQRAKAAASTEAFGSEQISKSGVSDAGAILRQISGATVSEGKFAVVRGLSDRYVSTTLNGANLPSADPYRQSVPLDLFPAQVIDRVVVTKTFTPDQPGSSTGGGIDVVTKSFPEKSFATFSLGGEYNTQSTLNRRFLTYDGGGHDWAAMDDGTRALPSTVNRIAPQGKQLPTPRVGNLLLNAGNFSTVLHEQLTLDQVTSALQTTDFAPRREAPPFNHNFSTAFGGVTHLLGAPLGYFGGASYKHDYSFYENGVSSRYQTGTSLKSKFRDARSLSTVNWSGMVNLAYLPIENHELGFTFFYNQNAVDDVRIQDQGYDANNSTGGTFRKENLYWTERNLNTYQMKGEHHVPDFADLQFNWLIALTETTQDEPDARFFNDNNSGSGYQTGGVNSNPKDPTRYFRELSENNRNIKLDWTLPFRNWEADEGQFKFGLFDSFSKRTFTERQFYYPGRGGYNDDPNRFLTDSQLGLTSITTNYLGGQPRSLRFNWGDYVQVFDSQYSGERSIQAGYLMLDIPVVDKLRLVGGARYETTDLAVHSESYLPNSNTGLKTNDTDLVRQDLLPSVGMIYAVNSNMNVRVSYSHTVARPSFRELAAYYSYDPVISDFVEGNPLLRMTSIKNYDFRWEWFPRPGELFSVSAFYKQLTDVIERGNKKIEGDVITFFNNDATLYGIEFEARKNLDFISTYFDRLSLGGNFSLIESEVKLRKEDLAAKRAFFPNIKDTRSLYDQSPYIVNLDLNYNNTSSGTSASVIYNVAGPRIAIAKLNTEDVYEQPAPTLDFVLSQRIGRNLTVKFGAKNLLDPKIERTYGKSSNLLYSSYRKGRGFGLSMNYEF